MAQTQHGVLVEGPVGAALRKMAVPMAFGMIFMIAVNLIDTFWVAKLGTRYVAAMTFTFPVIGLIINLALGVMIGTSTAVARIIGSGDREGAQTLTRHALVLSILMVVAFSVMGVLTQDWIFRLLGAEGEILELTKTYMTIWYLGVVFLMVPLVMNGVLRARGDARTPMVVMMLAAIVNAILDPVFIFGWGPVPAMGFEGAAIATLLSRIVGMIYVFSVILRRKDLLRWTPAFDGFQASVRRFFPLACWQRRSLCLGPPRGGIDHRDGRNLWTRGPRRLRDRCPPGCHRDDGPDGTRWGPQSIRWSKLGRPPPTPRLGRYPGQPDFWAPLGTGRMPGDYGRSPADRPDFHRRYSGAG